MLLKRHYKRDAPKDDWVLSERACPQCHKTGMVYNHLAGTVTECTTCEGAGIERRRIPPLDYVRILHTGVRREQKFTPRFIMRGLEESWVELGELQLCLIVQPEPLTYEILENVGRYCDLCHRKLPDDPTGIAARIHIKEHHAGHRLPPNRSGYHMNNAYVCRLAADQHFRWQVPPYATVSHTRWKG